jgi:hypothetical protein
VIGAVDVSAAAGPVLLATKAVAHLLGATPRALHVSEDGFAEISATVAGAGLELELDEPPVAAALARAAQRPGVGAVVLGARGMPAGRMPAGHTALELITSVDTPLVVVPPLLSSDRISRVLVALDGTPAVAAAMAATLTAARDRDVEIILVHVHEASAVPPFDDHPPHELEAWSQEFVARWCPGVGDVARLEVRVGDPARCVADAARECAADLVALSWSRTLSPGHGAVVREALERSTIPILLLPVS